MYHVFADVGEFAGGQVIPTRSSDALQVDGLALHKDGKMRLLLANLTDKAQTVTVQGLGLRVRARWLDETNAEEAMRAPEQFRAVPGETLPTDGGVLRLAMRPYAVARIDAI